MTATARAVTIVQHVEPEGPGAIREALRAHGCDLRVVQVHRGDRIPSSTEGTAGLVIMGGPMGVRDTTRYPHLTGVMRLIDRTLQAGLPVLGICLGSQMLASALGAAIRTAPRQEIGWHAVTLTGAASQDALFFGVEPVFDAFHWHGDVFDLPPGAVSLASSKATVHQAFRWGANAYGLLFHLEVDAAGVGAMARAFEDELVAAGLDGRQILDGSGPRFERLCRIGSTVFGRWADLSVQAAPTGGGRP